jgi:hypothetical protein
MTALFLVRILLDANLSTGGLESLFLSQPDVLESHILFSLSNPCFFALLPFHPTPVDILTFRIFTLMVLSVSTPDSIVGFLGNVFLRQTSNTRSVNPT